MNKNYSKLLEPITLPNGANLDNRIVMAPMVVNGSEKGKVTDLDVDYFDVRSDVAGLIITGAASVSYSGWDIDTQLAAFDDKHTEGLSKIAKAAKQDGNKAILQLQHSGRGAQYAYELTGEALAPSKLDFPFLNYEITEMTENVIWEVIEDYGQATRRALEAGFDGIEIHGANHYLIQQFFSRYSNHRTDQWGGSFENRSRFAMEIVKEIKRVVRDFGKDDAIIGYRITSEEIHGGNIGYRIYESLQLADLLADQGIDYMHLSMFTKYDSRPEGSRDSYSQMFHKVVGDRVPVITVSGVFNAADALNALDYGDMIAIGRESLIEPEFAKKIREGNTDKIRESIGEDYEELNIPPKGFGLFTMENTPLPPLPGIKNLDDEVRNAMGDREYTYDTESNQ